MTALTNYHHPGGLEQQVFAVSQSQRPEGQSQAVSRAVLSLRSAGKGLFQVSPLASGRWLSILACGHVTLYLHVGFCVRVQTAPFYKGTSHLGLGSTLLQCDLI